MNYTQAMEFINSYTKSGKPIENLDRIKGLMKKLGDPQRSLGFVHIAGTNGKGSITEMISCAFIDAHYKTGQFTSPYIVEFEDRIRINSENIPKEKVAYFADFVKKNIDDECYSQFEIIFAIAMLYFAEEKVDIVCLEAGMGGLLDATNVIDCPEISVIASISLDHTDILGKTAAEIALQKAGIIKKNGVAVASLQNGNDVLKVISDYAEKVGATLYIPKKFEKIQANSFLYNDVEYQLSMTGEHQLFNATTAIEALLNLSSKYKISTQNIKNGIKNARVRARFEILSENPRVYFDGAHNPDATFKLCETLSAMEGEKIAIVGMINSKDAKSAIENIAKCFESVICIDSFYPNAIDRNVLAEIFRSNGVEAYTSTFEDSIKNAEILSENTKFIVIFGSLYLYSDILRLIQN